MNLTDFIKLGLDNHDNKLIKINYYLNSSKESFIQFIEDFPVEEQYQNAKKEVISSFYSSNPIENQKDIDIIQTQAGKYTNQNIYSIIGANLELKDITQILKIPNESHYFIHGYRAALNRSGEKQDNIDKIGEKILNSIIQQQLKPTQGESDSIIREISFKPSSNFLAIFKALEKPDIPIAENFQYRMAVKKHYDKQNFDMVVFLDSYFSYTESDKNKEAMKLVIPPNFQLLLFTPDLNGIKKYGEDLFYEKRLEHIKLFYERYEKDKKYYETKNTFDWWFNQNIDQSNVNSNGTRTDAEQKKGFLNRLKKFAEYKQIESKIEKPKTHIKSLKI